MASDTIADIVAEMSGKQTERQLREAKKAKSDAQEERRPRTTSSPGAAPLLCWTNGTLGIGSGKRSTSAPDAAAVPGLLPPRVRL